MLWKSVTWVDKYHSLALTHHHTFVGQKVATRPQHTRRTVKHTSSLTVHIHLFTIFLFSLSLFSYPPQLRKKIQSPSTISPVEGGEGAPTHTWGAWRHLYGTQYCPRWEKNGDGVGLGGFLKSFLCGLKSPRLQINSIIWAPWVEGSKDEKRNGKALFYLQQRFRCKNSLHRSSLI